MKLIKKYYIKTLNMYFNQENLIKWHIFINFYKIKKNYV